MVCLVGTFAENGWLQHLPNGGWPRETPSKVEKACAARARSRRLVCRHLGRWSSRRLGNLHSLPPAPVAPVPVTPRHRLRGLQCTKALMICRPLLSLTKAYASTTAASQLALHCTGKHQAALVSTSRFAFWKLQLTRFDEFFDRNFFFRSNVRPSPKIKLKRSLCSSEWTNALAKLELQSPPVGQLNHTFWFHDFFFETSKEKSRQITSASKLSEIFNQKSSIINYRHQKVALTNQVWTRKKQLALKKISSKQVWTRLEFWNKNWTKSADEWLLNVLTTFFGYWNVASAGHVLILEQ